MAARPAATKSHRRGQGRLVSRQFERAAMDRVGTQHPRASAANLLHPRDPITSEDTQTGRAAGDREKKLLPQMHADKRRYSIAVGSFAATSTAGGDERSARGHTPCAAKCRKATALPKFTQQSASRATVAIRVMAGAGRRRPAIHDFSCCQQHSRGWPACARHDGRRQCRLTSRLHSNQSLSGLCALIFFCALCVKNSFFAANHSALPLSPCPVRHNTQPDHCTSNRTARDRSGRNGSPIWNRCSPPCIGHVTG